DGAPRQVHGIGTAGAGVLDGVDRRTGDARGREDDLAKDRFLAGDGAAERIADERRLDGPRVDPGIGQSCLGHRDGQLGQRRCREPAEPTDADAGNERDAGRPGSAGAGHDRYPARTAKPFAVSAPSALTARRSQVIAEPSSATPAVTVSASPGKTGAVNVTSSTLSRSGPAASSMRRAKCAVVIGPCCTTVGKPHDLANASST